MKKVVISILIFSLLLATAVFFGIASFADEAPTVSIKYHNLAYRSNVSIKYAVEAVGVPDGVDIADAVGIKLTKGDPASSEVYEAKYEGQYIIYGKEYAVFDFSELSAAEMTVDVYATPYLKISDTKTVTGKTYKNSILDYSYKALGKIEGGTSVPDNVKRLVTCMLQYGSAVQMYTGTNTDRLADSEYYRISVVNGTLTDGFRHGLYSEGESVTLLPEVREGYMCNGWKNSQGKIVSSQSTLTVTAGSSDETYTAIFKEAPVTYMQYDIPDNFYDGYTDPFGMESSDYKEMTVKLVNDSTYRISYLDNEGGTFSADFVQKAWGMWMMGTMSYTTKGGKVHTITDSSTDYEFVFSCKGESYYDWRSGNHGNYPGRELEKYYYEDDTSLQNDILLDMTFYDGKSGEKIVLDTVGDSIKVNGLRVVVHHNIYEMNYKKEHVLFNSERSYLYNGYDVMFDAQLRATQDVHFSTANYSAMMPIAKEYGNCAMFYCVDDSTVFMKTPMSNTQNDAVWGVNATKIDFWGENNPKYHITISINNPEDQLRDSVEGRTDKGYAGFREMLGGTSNKFYCSFLSTGGTLAWGEELHFNTTYSFSIQDDFVNPDREPDYWVGRQ